MPFQPGHSKSGGRKKGSKNKKTVLRVEDVLLAANINPAEMLLALLPHLQPKDAARVLLELQSYIEPKPRVAETAAAEAPEPLDDSDDALMQAVECPAPLS